MNVKITGIFVCILMLVSIPLAMGTTDNKNLSELQVVTITRPTAGRIYLFDAISLPIGGSTPIIIGRITLQATAQANVAFAGWEVKDIQGNLCSPDWPQATPPNFQQVYVGRHFWLFHPPFYFPSCTITVRAYDSGNNLLGTQSINAYKIF